MQQRVCLLLLLFVLPQCIDAFHHAPGSLSSVPCSWLCPSDCESTCVAICKPPRCTTICLNSTTATCQSTSCWQTFSPANATDECPIATTQCNPPICTGECEIECQEPECSWVCEAPVCKGARGCELICEQPACMYTQQAVVSDATDLVIIPLGFVIAWIVTVIVLL